MFCNSDVRFPLANWLIQLFSRSCRCHLFQALGGENPRVESDCLLFFLPQKDEDLRNKGGTCSCLEKLSVDVFLPCFGVHVVSLHIFLKVC